MDSCSEPSCNNTLPCALHQGDSVTLHLSSSSSSPTSVPTTANSSSETATTPTTTTSTTASSVKKKTGDLQLKSSLSTDERIRRCFQLLSEALKEQHDQATIPIENSLQVTKDLLSMHTERVNHEITRFVVMVTQSPDVDALESFAPSLLRYLDEYLSIHRVLLMNAGGTKKNLCIKSVQSFLSSLQVVMTQASERMLGEEKSSSSTAVPSGSNVSVLGLELKTSTQLPSSVGVSLASHTGACLEACKALAAVPLTNHTAVTKALLAVLSLVKDAKAEIAEILEENKDMNDDDDEEEDDALSPEELKRVKLATEASNLVYSTIRKLYEFTLRCTTIDANPAHVEWLEAQLQSCTRLSTGLDNLGATLYAPQDVPEVRKSMTQLGQELDSMLARFPTHPEFHLIFKLTFPAKEQQEQDPDKIAAACDSFIAKCRASIEKIVRQVDQ